MTFENWHFKLAETSAFDTLLQTVRLPAILSDESGRLLGSNPAARASFGDMPEGTIIHLKFRSPELRSELDAAIANRETRHCDYHVRVPVERWFRVELAPVAQSEGSLNCLLLFQDVSESRKIDQMRADFIANASHELRTPLASLSGFIETLRGPARDDAPARERFLSIMQDQAHRMSRLIDDLLSLSRLEMRPFAQLTEQVDLAALVRSVIDGFLPKAAHENVAIELLIAPGPNKVRGIRDELNQAIENLVENAIKYGRTGGRIIVSLETAQTTGDLQLSVRDFGPGIPAADLPRLTERFYRSEAGHDSSIKGTGLGLAIVKHIVQRHQGQLAIQSSEGNGAIFTIRLPSH